MTHAFTLSGQATDAAATEALQLANGDWAVIHLLAIHSAQPDKNGAEYKATREKMDSSAGNESYALYQQALRQAAKVERRDTTTDKETESESQ